MTFAELANWAKATKKLDEQVVIALEEEEDGEPDENLPGVGRVCYLPFTAATIPAGKRMVKGIPWPEEEHNSLHIMIWDDEEKRTVEEPYTWGDLVKWVEGLSDPNMEQHTIAAWHGCDLKFLDNGMLYAWVIDPCNCGYHRKKDEKDSV